jgi:hypothetical protein
MYHALRDTKYTYNKPNENNISPEGRIPTVYKIKCLYQLVINNRLASSACLDRPPTNRHEIGYKNTKTHLPYIKNKAFKKK